MGIRNTNREVQKTFFFLQNKKDSTKKLTQGLNKIQKRIGPKVEVICGRTEPRPIFRSSYASKNVKIDFEPETLIIQLGMCLVKYKPYEGMSLNVGNRNVYQITSTS